MPVGEMKKPLLQARARTLEASSISDPVAPLVGILGTGDFSCSLAHRLVATGYQVVVGSRTPKRSTALFPEEAEVTTQLEAATQADLVFIALFPEHYSTLVGLRQALSGKPLVDVSNGVTVRLDGPSHAEQLGALFPESDVVKGFNVISAWTLQTGPRDGSRQVPICGDSSSAKAALSQVARAMGFVPVDGGPLSSALEAENAPLRLFPAWHSPVRVTLLLFLVFYAYNALRDVAHPYATAGRSALYKLPVETVNATLPAVALVTLALVYLPGVLAALLQLRRGTKYQRFPDWLDGWLRHRKPLGLCGFLCAALHAVYSLCLPMRRSARYKLLNEAFKQVKEGREMSWSEDQVWRMELYLSAGILALGLLSLLALVSLPSVANGLNWREFTFIQSRLGYSALSTATLHALLYGWDRAFDPTRYHFYLPPTFVLALVLPCCVLLGRLALAAPCAARRLARIRRGWEEAGSHIRFTLPEEDGGALSREDVSKV